jgi:hypothetical protein
MLLTLLVMAVGIGVILFYVGFRAPSTRVLFFSAMAYLKGIPILWVDSPAMAARVLKVSSTKGKFIEHMLSAPAWKPVISLEAVDDPLWSEMKANFTVLMKTLATVQQLYNVTESITDKFLENNEILDSPGIVYITIAAFYEWIFDRPFPEDATFVGDSTWEWRKELALKGKANSALKDRVVSWLLSEIRVTPALYDIFRDKWSDPAYYSLLLQPFFLSPAINVSDVAVTMRHLKGKSRGLEGADLINHALDISHPFVILERYLEHGLYSSTSEQLIPPKTHVFVPMDVMNSDNLIRFGAGARKCPGQHYAMAIMQAIFRPSVLEHVKFQPEKGHVFSGRDQDGQESMTELLYQGRLIIKLFWNQICSNSVFSRPEPRK